jgi:hypothetical protein
MWCKCEASLLSIVSSDFSIVPKSPLWFVYWGCFFKFSFLSTDKGKLRTYTTFNVHFGFEHYLSVIGNFDHRRCLTKLRISAHRLHIETGRHQGIPPHQRLCGQCDSGEVEDEIHFLLCCSKCREERQQLFRTISQSCNNFLQLNPQEFFLLVNDLWGCTFLYQFWGQNYQ